MRDQREATRDLIASIREISGRKPRTFDALGAQQGGGGDPTGPGADAEVGFVLNVDRLNVGRWQSNG